MRENTTRPNTAILRSTCIANLPTEALGNNGFIICKSDTTYELDMIELGNWSEKMKATEEKDDKNNSLLKDLIKTAYEYHVYDEGPTAYVGEELVSYLGEAGDKVTVFYDEKEGIWKIRNTGRVELEEE